MTAIVLIAALLVVLSAFIVGRITAGRRYQSRLSALGDKYSRNLDGAGAVIQNLKREAESFRPALIRATAHLVWSAQESDAAGNYDVGKARRGAAQALNDALGSDPETDFGVKKLTGEVAHA